VTHRWADKHCYHFKRSLLILLWFVFIQGLMCLSCGALYNPAPLHGLSTEESWIKSFCSRKVAAAVQHAPSVRIKTQENQKIHGVQQKLPGDSHTAAQRWICGVHAFGGEHGPGMSRGSCAETRVTRGRSVRPLATKTSTWFNLVEITLTHHGRVFILACWCRLESRLF